jgi:hypothetical protein
MKEFLIEQFKMRRTDVGKYNTIFENDDWVLIWNRVNGQIKLKPKEGKDDRDRR